LRSAYLEPLLRGEKQGAFAFTEPADAERPTWASYDGDDLLVHGRKAYVSGGATADFMTALVNVEPAGSAPGGTAMAVIDFAAQGVRIEQAFRSMEGGGHVSLTLDGVRVPQWHVIGAIGEGLPRAMRNIDGMRLGVAARATGLIRWAADHLAEHLQSPHRSGTPLGEREGVRLRYAELLVEGYAARSMLYRTARLVEAGGVASHEVAATKLYATEAASRAIDTAVQLVGGAALIVGHPLERTYREIRSLRLAEGASDLLRISIARARLEGGDIRM
jgi:alkylation response protein AidB-like acyl-CoA dehydrogenase